MFPNFINMLKTQCCFSTHGIYQYLTFQVQCPNTIVLNCVKPLSISIIWLTVLYNLQCISDQYLRYYHQLYSSFYITSDRNEVTGFESSNRNDTYEYIEEGTSNQRKKGRNYNIQLLLCQICR